MVMVRVCSKHDGDMATIVRWEGREEGARAAVNVSPRATGDRPGSFLRHLPHERCSVA